MKLGKKALSSIVLLTLLFVTTLVSGLNLTSLATSAASATSPPAVEWSQTYHRIQYEWARSVQQTSDGGYILAGRTQDDFWLVKTYADGGMQWSQTYGGTGLDDVNSVQQTSDDGYIMAGFTDSYGAGDYDFWLVKTYTNGTMQWSKTYGGTGLDFAYSVQQTSDGGYILAGYTYVSRTGDTGDYDFWLVKTYADGGMQWSQTYGGAGSEVAYSVQQTRDGGYIMAGYTDSYGAGGSNFWLVKTSSNGGMQWSKTYGGTGSEVAYSVQQTSDDGYIMAGFTDSYGAGGSDFWLVKASSTGGMQWSQTYGGASGDSAKSARQTRDGGYIMAGGTSSFGAGGSDAWVVKTNSTGLMEWSQTYGGTGSDGANSVQQTKDDGYIIAGSININWFDFWLIKLEGSKDTDGDGLLDSWEKNGIDYNNDGITDLDLTDLGADWQHKDLFVEVDYMQGHYPDPDAMTDVESAFANAPITNPDGIPGIRLHIDVDDQIPHQDVINRDFTKGFDGLKDLYFGNATQRSGANSLNVLDAKNLVYRYCLFIHKISEWNGTQDVETYYAGMGEMPGNDFIIAGGSFVGGLKTTRDDHAGGFMHELGHNLGLNHGGDVLDGINFKPNYLSVMNYAFCFSTLVPWRPLDYSRKELPTLYEGSLDEPYGIQSSGFWQYTVWNDSKKEIARGFADGPLDWNGNGNTTEWLVRANINNFPKWGCSSAPDEVLKGYNDWPNVKLAFGNTSQFAHGVHIQMSGDEITSDIVEAMRQSVLATHEVAVLKLTSSSAVWNQGSMLSINLTMGNLGGSDENVDVIVYANSTVIASSSLIVKASNLTNVTLSSNGQVLTAGTYTLTAHVSPVAGENYMVDNTVTGGVVTVSVNPSPTPTPSPSPSPTPTASPTPTPSPAPTSTPNPTQPPSSTPTPTAAPTPRPSSTPIPTPNQSPTPLPSQQATPTPEPTSSQESPLLLYAIVAVVAFVSVGATVFILKKRQ
jgi:hypothetical protein